MENRLNASEASLSNNSDHVVQLIRVGTSLLFHEPCVDFRTKPKSGQASYRHSRSFEVPSGLSNFIFKLLSDRNSKQIKISGPGLRVQQRRSIHHVNLSRQFLGS